MIRLGLPGIPPTTAQGVAARADPWGALCTRFRKGQLGPAIGRVSAPVLLALLAFAPGKYFLGKLVFGRWRVL